MCKLHFTNEDYVDEAGLNKQISEDFNCAVVLRKDCGPSINTLNYRFTLRFNGAITQS
jgi:hypothetical protein